MITASALSRLLNCPSSAVLPTAEAHSEWAELGQVAHDDLSNVGDPDHEFARLLPPSARSEVKLAFDVATGQGRIVGEGVGRAYGDVGPFEILGSADVLGVDGDAVVVVDFKTGFSDVEPAATNPQLAFYALAACRALGKDRAIVRIVYTQSNRCDEAELDAIDLAAFAGKLAALHTTVAGRQAAKQQGEILPTREGAWCKWCNSKPFCPSKIALLVRLADPAAVIGSLEMTPERAAAAHEQIVRVEQLLNDAKKRREQYVDEHGPIDLGGGRMFGRYVRNGNERLDGNVAVQAIAEIVGESAKEFERVAIERRTSKAAIERAAKSTSAPRGTTTKLVKRIRELGGSTHAPDTMPLGEYVRGDAEEAPALDVAAVNAALAEAG